MGTRTADVFWNDLAGLRISPTHKRRLEVLLSNYDPETYLYVSLENDTDGEDTTSLTGQLVTSLFSSIRNLLSHRKLITKALMTDAPTNKLNIFVLRDYNTIVDACTACQQVGSDLVDMHLAFPYHIITLYGKDCVSMGVYSEEEPAVWSNSFI